MLFQEHEIGVWVSQAISDGNGAKKGVQHGDQLAAINGNSSVHTTLDEVAFKISSTPNNQVVELTFLRYIGPLRPAPGSIIQQGFEVTDKTVSPLRKSMPGMFLKKSRSGELNGTSKSSNPRSKSTLSGSNATTSANLESIPVGSQTRLNSLAVATLPPPSPPKQQLKKKLSKLLSFKRKS